MTEHFVCQSKLYRSDVKAQYTEDEPFGFLELSVVGYHLLTLFLGILLPRNLF